MKSIRQRYKEFRALQAGSIVGMCAKTCLNYARAEYIGERFQICVQWEFDADSAGLGPEEWIDDPKYLKRWYKSHHCCEYAYIENEGDHIAGLGSIWDADENYRRIIEAELLSEVIPFNSIGYRLLTAEAPNHE